MDELKISVCKGKHFPRHRNVLLCIFNIKISGNEGDARVRLQRFFRRETSPGIPFQEFPFPLPDAKEAAPQLRKAASEKTI